MHTTLQLIDLAKQRLAAKHGLELPMSDYRLGKLLSIKQTTVSNWRSGRSSIGTEFAARFAEACDLNPEYVYACVQRERADTPEEISLLERIAERFKGTVPAVVACLVVMMAAGTFLASPETVAASTLLVANQTVHYAPLVMVLLMLAAHRSRRPRRAHVKPWQRFFTVFPVATLLEAA